MTCDFCEPSGISKRILLENELAFSFLTNIPITKGHSLIAPKRCVSKFEEITEEEARSILNLLRKVKNALAKAYGCEGFNYAWNEDKVAGQTVPHFHLHIVPRKKGDKGVYGYDARKFLYRPGSRDVQRIEELKEATEEIKSFM